MSDDPTSRRTLGRRHLLAGLVGVGFVGSAVIGGDTIDLGTGSESRLPVEVSTVDATGSTAGRASVPATGTPTVVDCFATWCEPCVRQMDALGAVHDRYADRVAFVSVTNERFGGGLDREALRAWWRDNDGRWALGHDPDGSLLAALGADGLPYLAVTDASGSIAWSHGGVASTETLDRRIASVLS
ncbi:TlpA disulfide reductase family protein [Haloplanus salilacus]|uniref:TlpA family protein disulfide reductase n=1 Tax=Haloplanus salilacus TaxID=2949994 RepID=UPI0030D28C9C